jgi:hypothetical protein
MQYKDEKPRNENGEFHGMWIAYSRSDKTNFWAKGMYINGVDLGFWIENIKDKLYYAR